MTTVTTITARAESSEQLTDQDYRDIYTELREHHSLDSFVALLGSQFSKGTWSRYERGQWELTREARQELRRAVGLPALPPTVGEAMAGIDPDAEVVRVGDGAIHRAILMGNTEPVTLHINGSVEVMQEHPVQGCTRSPAGRAWGRSMIRLAVANLSTDARRRWQELTPAERARIIEEWAREEAEYDV